MEIYQRVQDVTTFDKRVVIAHCISVDCAIGAGVALAIRKKHPNLKLACQQAVQSGYRCGTAFRFEDEKGVVYNLFSKERVRQNCQTLPEGVYYQQLEACLLHLRDQLLEHQEYFLALPKIGSGLDRANWNEVKRLIIWVFAETPIEIAFCDWR